MSDQGNQDNNGPHQDQILATQVAKPVSDQGNQDNNGPHKDQILATQVAKPVSDPVNQDNNGPHKDQIFDNPATLCLALTRFHCNTYRSRHKCSQRYRNVSHCVIKIIDLFPVSEWSEIS